MRHNDKPVFRLVAATMGAKNNLTFNYQRPTYSAPHNGPREYSGHYTAEIGIVIEERIEGIDKTPFKRLYNTDSDRIVLKQLKVDAKGVIFFQQRLDVGYGAKTQKRILDEKEIKELKLYINEVIKNRRVIAPTWEEEYFKGGYDITPGDNLIKHNLLEVKE